MLSIPPVIQLAGLTRKFGDLVAVNELSLDIYKGEVLGLLGPNGAGKTTTIMMICGLLKPTSGRISFNTTHISNDPVSNHNIGICTQENILWPKLTCMEQLKFLGEMYGLTSSVSRKRSEYLLETMGLSEKAGVLSTKLSGGMKRRLNICLTLIHDPEILIFDEPEAGLDPQSRILVRNYIKALARKKTIIVTTHNMDEADKLSDRVAIIDYGKLLLTDTPINLKKAIGGGDVLQIKIEIGEGDSLELLKNKLLGICDSVIISGDTMILKSKNLIGMLPDITHLLEHYGSKIIEMNLRENTLEDVFIHLTGRKLRE